MDNKELTLTAIQFDAFCLAVDLADLTTKAQSQIRKSKKYLDGGFGNRSVTLKFCDEDFEACLSEIEMKSEDDMRKVEGFLLNADKLGIDIKTFCGGVEVVKKLRKILNPKNDN